MVSYLIYLHSTLKTYGAQEHLVYKHIAYKQLFLTHLSYYNQKKETDMTIKLRIKEILEEKGKTNYWLSQQLGMCYRNYHNIVTNQTSAIRFDTLERLCEILDVPVGDLFEQIDEKKE